MTLIVAVDRIVESLRRLVEFINSASTFNLYLLEVQQYRAEDGLRLASINLFGGTKVVPKASNCPRTQWDQELFSESLESEGEPSSIPVVKELLAFINEEADSAQMGQGSVHFGVRQSNNKKLNLFYVNTKGDVGVSGVCTRSDFRST